MGETTQISVLQADGPWKIILRRVNKSLPRTSDWGEAMIGELVKDTETFGCQAPELARHPENGQEQILVK